MELTEDLLAQMGAYLSGQMNEPERQVFDARVRQDADLQRELVVQHELRQGLLLMAQRQRFKAMHTDLMARGLLKPATPEPTPISAGVQPGRVRPMPTRQSVFWSGRNYLTAAASLVLLIGVGWFFAWKAALPTLAVQQRDKAFDAVFTPDIKAAPSAPADPDLLGASPLGESASQDSLRLQKGVGLLLRQQPQPAIAQLQPIAQGLPGHWRASAQWYLALAYLKNGQPKQTDSLLALIAGANGHPYQLEARQLTNQLPHESTSRR